MEGAFLRATSTLQSCAQLHIISQHSCLTIKVWLGAQDPAFRFGYAYCDSYWMPSSDCLPVFGVLKGVCGLCSTTLARQAASSDHARRCDLDPCCLIAWLPRRAHIAMSLPNADLMYHHRHHSVLSFDLLGRLAGMQIRCCIHWHGLVSLCISQELLSPGHAIHTVFEIGVGACQQVKPICS